LRHDALNPQHPLRGETDLGNGSEEEEEAGDGGRIFIGHQHLHHHMQPTHPSPGSIALLKGTVSRGFVDSVVFSLVIAEVHRRDVYFCRICTQLIVSVNDCPVRVSSLPGSPKTSR
jgi:hypothetical protein